MQAITYDRFGSPETLRVSDLPDPVVGVGQALIQVRAAALNPKDSMVRKGRFALLSGRRFPKLLGYDFAGVVQHLSDSGEFEIGQSVFGMKNGFAGSTVAELVVVSTREMVPIPDGLSFEQAAALPLVSMTALQALRPALKRARPQSSQPEVLLHGASGGVGCHAIQIAKILGARVTTTSSSRNLQLCRELGADLTLDYQHDRPLEEREVFDVIFDIFGNLCYEQAKAALRPGGTYITTVPTSRILLDWLRTLFGSKRARLVIVRSNKADLLWVREASSRGQLKAVIDRVFPFLETAKAQTLIESKRAKGKVVISPINTSV